MDRLTSMAVFVKAADLGSFTAAADAFDMSPQMVAKHVVFLEDRLGTTLLSRTTRRQSLTDVGRAFYERCRLVLAEVDAAETLAHEMHSQPKGVIRVNAPLTFGTFSLAPFVLRYLDRFPEVDVDLTLCDRLVDPLEEGFEVLVRIGAQEEAGLIARPLRPYRMIACAAPAYLAARGTPQTPAELTHHACLTYAKASPVLPCRWIFGPPGHGEEVAVRGRFHSNDWKSLLLAALAGHGIILGPETVLGTEVAAGRLVRVLADHDGPARPMAVLCPAGRRPTVKVRSFVEAVIAEFGPES